jgi:hypothetical protein
VWIGPMLLLFCVMGFFYYLAGIEYFRLNIEYLRFASGGSFLKKPIKIDGAKRLPQIFNLQYSIVNYPPVHGKT